MYVPWLYALYDSATASTPCHGCGAGVDAVAVETSPLSTACSCGGGGGGRTSLSGTGISVERLIGSCAAAAYSEGDEAVGDGEEAAVSTGLGVSLDSSSWAWAARPILPAETSPKYGNPACGGDGAGALGCLQVCWPPG